MELRVWVDGAPRVVCGVTADTTCQTGRFALMETWQDVERPLAPKERPLDVISRRGLRAGESSFILRRTGLQIDSSGSAAWFGHSAGEIVGHPLQRRSLPTKALISKAEREAKDQGEVVRRIRCRAQTLTGGVYFSISIPQQIKYTITPTHTTNLQLPPT
uniref:Ras-associating domain-containing protein n=1 Tax=Eptatretus burgeri TaxID=7764 RepID=A0A8C4PWT7_EPTBU